jgi:hypothetical protein
MGFNTLAAPDAGQRSPGFLESGDDSLAVYGLQVISK